MHSDFFINVIRFIVYGTRIFVYSVVKYRRLSKKTLYKKVYLFNLFCTALFYTITTYQANIASYPGIIASDGQASTHVPQSVHISGSIT